MATAGWYLLLLLAFVEGYHEKDPSRCMPPRFDASKLYPSSDKLFCKELKQTCVEQSGFIVYDEALVKDNPNAKGLLNLDFTFLRYHHRHHNPWIKHENETVHGNTLYYHVTAERVVIRLPTKKEWSTNRYFSNCTMPIIFYENWQHNPTEFIQRSPALLALNQKSGAWDMNASIVMALPAGIEPLPFATTYLQAFSTYKVTTLTRFSELAWRRGRHVRSSATWEGVPVHCFARVVICSLINGAYPGMYLSGQRIYEYYKGKQALPPPNPKGGTFFSSGSNSLKVLFEKRPGNIQMRQILNLEDLINASPSFAWDLDPASGYDSVEMKYRTFGDNLRDIAIMREVDVFITPHSAGSMHAHFMRKHSSFIELRPFEFGTKHSFMSKMVWGSVCPNINFDLLCWFMNLDEEGSWTPGVYEKYEIPNESGQSPTMRARDRNVIVKNEWLAFMLRKIVKVKQNVSEYEQLWRDFQVGFTFVNGTIISEKQIF